MTQSVHREEMLGSAYGSIDESDFIGQRAITQSGFPYDVASNVDVTGTATPEDRFKVLQEMTSDYLTAKEKELLKRAYRFANEAHKGQCRKSGEPFVAHPVEVAIILADLRMDIDTLCAALLHDTVEDTETTHEQIASLFGAQVADLVEGVTKISQIEVESLSGKQAETIRKMFVAMSKDIRVVVIKLADRLHNMRTLAALREDRRIFKARETLEIYAPIANRLGIESIKWELEDLAFYYLEPNKYKQVARMVMESRASREEYIGNVVDILKTELKHVGIEGHIAGRPKHLYSIYQKMIDKGKGFSEIFDLIAVRIIVKSIKDCYSSLGAVHSLWRPIPGRFKDYIAMPKFNRYQSLHTTVIGPAARPLEVQIRTEEMHHTSEFGVAAHWRYKDKGAVADEAIDEQLTWLREMIDWQDETRDPHEFLNALKIDLEASEVYVFTPKGDVIDLRRGSTPVDFAYAIHTEVGHHCVGAKVNGSIVPLTYALKMGDRVEILTQKSATPSRDWLSIVKTPSARSKIRSYFSKISRGDDLQNGRDKLMREMRKHGMGISSAQAARAIKTVAEHLGYKDDVDMLVQIGTNKESPQHVANRLLKLLVDRSTRDSEKPGIGASAVSTGKLPPMITSVKRPKHHATHTANGVMVRGLSDVLVHLAKCCNPVPGDDIIGFVTRGRGVSVHQRICPNAIALAQEPERIIEVSWDTTHTAGLSYTYEIEVCSLDRMFLLRDVSAVLSEHGVNVLSCSLDSHKDGIVSMRFLFQVSDVSSITSILQSLLEVEGVFDAHRMMVGTKSE